MAVEAIAETFGTHPPRILVVDDNDGSRGVLGRLLGRRGYTVFEAESGEQALAKLARPPPDIVLLDLNMPHMSGLETLREMRRIHDAADLPVIVVTAEHDRDVLAQCIAAGANDYVTKPVQWAILEARIQTHLGVHAVHAELRHDRERLEAAIINRAYLIMRIDQVLEHQRRGAA